MHLHFLLLRWTSIQLPLPIQVFTTTATECSKVSKFSQITHYRQNQLFTISLNWLPPCHAINLADLTKTSTLFSSLSNLSLNILAELTIKGQLVSWIPQLRPRETKLSGNTTALSLKEEWWIKIEFLLRMGMKNPKATRIVSQKLLKSKLIILSNLD